MRFFLDRCADRPFLFVLTKTYKTRFRDINLNFFIVNQKNAAFVRIVEPMRPTELVS